MKVNLSNSSTNQIKQVIVNFVFAFIYNKLYINDLLASGYVASDDTSRKILTSKGFIK